MNNHLKLFEKMNRETQEYYWDLFYTNNVEGQINEKGEAYIEWLTTKASFVRQANYLRNKYNLEVASFEKEGNPDWLCIFIKPKLTKQPN